MTVAHTMALALLIWMLIALSAFLLMSVWTDGPDRLHRHLLFRRNPMAVLIIVLKTVVAVLSVLLSLLILLHKGKGGGLSDMFGGGLTANAGTSGVAERNLNRWTVGIAILWAVLIIAIGLIGKLT